jgi:uncharacterized heparinase superfamily protein
LRLLASANRYWHTIRHLKPVQLYGRVAFRVLRPTPDLSPAPMQAKATGSWVKPACRPASLVAPTTFAYLGVQARLEDIGWDGPAMEKLWRYNQHYFDDLNAAGAHERTQWHARLMSDWISHNAPGTGTGWEPYPTSLRIVNWAKWVCAGKVLSAEALDSLAVQARLLTRRLERHLLGNHLFVNAKALVFAGLVFRGREAERWLALGLGIIDCELPQQLLADGGNFERSTMYHAIFLEDLLDLINVARAYEGRVAPAVRRTWEQAALRMLDWLQGMTHPDGEIALFNDAAFGIAPNYVALASYAEALGLARNPARAKAQPACLAWPDSGYVRLEAAHAVAVADVGPVGPDYLPGHAHADTLSFELSLFGQRVVVNGGTSRYGLGPERERERATCSHSIVEIDGQSSSEVWSGFRVARRAYPFGLSIADADGAVTVACSHDGYRRLAGKPVHRRSWTLRDCQLDVVDRIEGRCHSAVARYILHPDVVVEQCGEHSFALTLAGGQRCVFKIADGRGRLEPARYAPAFGTVKETTGIVIDLHDNAATVSIHWS